jgi:hypothetical protein
MIWLTTVGVFAYLYGITGRPFFSLGVAAGGLLAYGLYWMIRMRIIMSRPEFILEQDSLLYSPTLRVEKFATGILWPVVVLLICKSWCML